MEEKIKQLEKLIEVEERVAYQSNLPDSAQKQQDEAQNTGQPNGDKHNENSHSNPGQNKVFNDLGDVQNSLTYLN